MNRRRFIRCIVSGMNAAVAGKVAARPHQAHVHLPEMFLGFPIAVKPLNARNVDVITVCKWFGVPPHMMGVMTINEVRELKRAIA